MNEICAKVIIRMRARENETQEEIEDRFYGALNWGLCDSSGAGRIAFAKADEIDFEIIDSEYRESYE